MPNKEIVRLKTAVTDRDHVAGPQSAPVTLVEYGNFECIHCGRSYPVIKEVRKLLGDSLRFVFHHFPTVRTHPHSLGAAEAAEAAAAQGKFWEMHDELFTHQQALENRDLSADVGSLLAAIKLADTEGLIQFPDSVGGIRGLISRLRRGANG